MYTQKEFEKIVYDNNPYVKIIGTYTKMKDKIECQCLICGKKYFATAYDVKIGKKHKECSYILGTRKRTKTHNEFVEEMNNISPNIKIIGEYKSAKIKIKCKCILHDVEFESTPTHLLKGQTGCNICKNKKIGDKNRMKHNDFIIKANKNNDKLEILGKYKDMKSPILVKCKKCGFEWKPIAESVISGFGCPKCVGRYKTTDEFIQEIKDINPYITILGNYTKSHDIIKCQCKICNYIWSPVASNLFYSGCPKCNISHGEKAIMKWLDDKNIKYIWQKKYDDLLGIRNGKLSYDFYISDYNLLIEYQGEFHDNTVKDFMQSIEEFQIQQIHDKKKKAYAEKHKIKLLEIWYYDYDNIEQILERNIALNKDPVTTTVT